MQNNIQRFDFLTLQDFSCPIEEDIKDEIIKEETPPPPPPPTTYSEAELAQHKKVAWQEGYERAMSEQVKKTENKSNEIKKSLIILAENIADILKNSDEENKNNLLEIQHDIVQLSLMVAKKVTNDILEKNTPAIVGAMIEKYLPRLTGEISIKITVNPVILEEVEPYITGIIKTVNFSGNIAIDMDETLAISDCRINWPSGNAVRNIETLWQEIEGQLL